MTDDKVTTRRGVREYEPNSLAVELAASRPPADPSVEQFHMMPDSMARLTEGAGQFLQGKRVLFIGDDDHMSVMFSAFHDVTPVVLEYDDRVLASLDTWLGKLSTRQAELQHYDVRNPLPLNFEKCDAFFINPPYSSKTGGHAIRVWLTRALAGCVKRSDGIILLPRDESLDWVNECWLDMQRFFSLNGCRIMTQQNRLTQMYEGTNDPGLQSEAVFLRRFDPSRVKEEDPRAGEQLYR